MQALSGSPVRRRAGRVLVLSLLPLMVGVGVAWAAVTDNMFPTSATNDTCRTSNDYPCQTDNASVSYYMDSSGQFELEATDRQKVQDALKGEYSPTELAVSYDSSPVFLGSGQTDIIYQEGSTGLSDNLAGITWCNAASGSTRGCDQQYIRVRGGGYYTYARSCHETGHAVGLQHGDNASPTLSKTDSRLGCMATPSDGHNDLGANNRDNINATY